MAQRDPHVGFQQISSTEDADQVSVSGEQAQFGQGGSDNLTFSETSPFSPGLGLGGRGSDTYVVEAGENGAVFDGFGSSGDRLEMSGISFENAVAAQIDGRHLWVGSADGATNVVVLDWRDSDHRIESFSFSDGSTLSFDQATNAIDSGLEGYLGNFSLEQALSQAQFDIGIDAGAIRNAVAYYDNATPPQSDDREDPEPQPEPEPDPEPPQLTFNFTSSNGRAEAITAVYVGYYNRAADPAGLQYWTDQLEIGINDDRSASEVLVDIANQFAAVPETRNKYGILNDPEAADTSTYETFVTEVYQNIFDRPPEADGRQYWTDRLEDGLPPGVAILDILQGARNTDIEVIEQKIAASQYYTEVVGDGDASFDEALAQEILDRADNDTPMTEIRRWIDERIDQDDDPDASSDVRYEEDFTDAPGWSARASSNAASEATFSFETRSSGDMYLQAVVADQNDDWFALSNSPSFEGIQPGESFTISFDFNPISPDWGHYPGVEFGNSEWDGNRDTRVDNLGLHFRISWSDNVYQKFQLSSDGISGGNAGNGNRVASPTIPEEDAWYDVRISHDAGSGSLDLEVREPDGDVFYQTTVEDFSLPSVMDQVRFGEMGSGPAYGDSATIGIDNLQITAGQADDGDRDTPDDRDRELFKVTNNEYSVEDAASGVSSEFGNGYRLADWNDIEVAWENGYQDYLSTVFEDSGGTVTRDGDAYWSGDRSYFVSDHDGSTPSGWLDHDNVGNHEIDLGSWYAPRKAVAVNKDLFKEINGNGDLNDDLPAPVLHISFDDGITDIGPNQLSLDVTGTRVGQGHDGQPSGARIFDGVDDKIVTQDSEALQMDDEMSVAAWVRPDGTDGNGFVAAQGTIFDTTGNWQLPVNNNGALLNVNNLGGDWPILSDVQNDGTWHHIAFVWDEGTVKGYHDGEREYTFDAPAAAFLNATDDGVKIGADELDDDHFIGAIDDFRLYDAALSDAQVASLVGLGAQVDTDVSVG